MRIQRRDTRTFLPNRRPNEFLNRLKAGLRTQTTTTTDMNDTANNNTPYFPPAPECLLSVMVDNLQQLGAKAGGLHIAPRWREDEFAPSTRSALREAMQRGAKTSTEEAA